MMSLISLLVFVVIIGLVLYLFEKLPLPYYLKVVVRVLAILILMVWLLQLLGFSGGPNLHLR